MTLNKQMKHERSVMSLPPIPDKRYFTISEASELCALESYILRYWEQEFAQLRPAKREGRRYYQAQDILLIRQIKKLLYEEGYTIEGARLQLQNSSNTINPLIKKDAMLKKVIADLENVLQNLLTD